MARVSTACILCQEKDLTDGCKKALALIFKICDMDNDGVMSDTGGLGKTFIATEIIARHLYAFLFIMLSVLI